MKAGQSKSTLHLQLGQETIYLIMAVAVVAAIYFAMRLLSIENVAQHDAPIITLDEADGYTFATGSAFISPEFRRQLDEKVIPKVEDAGLLAGATIIEVVGHTDEVPLKSSKRFGANLDATLMPFLKGVTAVQPIPADNVGLGMARAVAVSSFLRHTKLSQSFVIIPMSAGAFLKPDDSAALGTDFANDAGRRRIEIRLRRRVERTKAR